MVNFGKDKKDFGDSFVWKDETRMYTDVFSFKKDSKKKGVCFSGRGGLSLGFQYFTCFTL